MDSPNCFSMSSLFLTYAPVVGKLLGNLGQEKEKKIGETKEKGRKRNAFIQRVYVFPSVSNAPIFVHTLPLQSGPRCQASASGGPPSFSDFSLVNRNMVNGLTETLNGKTPTLSEKGNTILPNGKTVLPFYQHVKRTQ